MRPVDKGIAPIEYNDYKQARHYLANRIGYYCSYCEMKIYNSIEVEHIIPRNRAGSPLDWSNFLLSCKYCNTIKSDNNDNIDDYLWPDRDNTDLAFSYDETNIISPRTNLSSQLRQKANNTISLTGLNRSPNTQNHPTGADTRWRSREEVWTIARKNLKNWIDAPIIQMAQSIANCALISGHYSIWIEIFKDDEIVLQEIDNAYYTKHLFKKYDTLGNRIIRINGLL